MEPKSLTDADMASPTAFIKRSVSLIVIFFLSRSIALGVNGHLRVVTVQQPPFTIMRLDGSWTGIEIRFLEILSGPLNFTFEIAAASHKILVTKDSTWASSDHAVVFEVASGSADLGIGGVHLAPGSAEENSQVRTVYSHSQDCGVFLTQASLALPRHRAIMGPFHWKVWLSLTIAYLFASVPLAILYTAGDRASGYASSIATPTRTRCHSVVSAFCVCVHRIHDAFWDVFGTFTNAFTLENGWRSVGSKDEEEEEEEEEEGEWKEFTKRSPSTGGTDARKSSLAASWMSSLQENVIAAIVGREGLRLLVAFYWAFTVIVSALYTGSIIAFITLPIFPKPYETGEELLEAGFAWGTIADGDWAQWLRESDGPVGEQVRKTAARADAYGCGCRGMRLFRSAEKGIRTVEQSSGLAFLSSRSLLTYLIAHPASGNEEEDEDEEETGLFSLRLLRKVVGKKRKGPIMAMSTECFLPFRIGFLVKGGAEGERISEALKRGLLHAEQAGLLDKGRSDADLEVGAGEEEEVDKEGSVISSSEKRWRAMHGQRILLGGGFRLGRHGVLTERVLGLDDVQGIFLLLGAGFAISFFALFMEIVVVKIKRRCCSNSRSGDDETDLGSEFSDEEVEVMDEESWHYEAIGNETYNEDEEWMAYSSDAIVFPRRTSAPAVAMNLYHRELLRQSITPRRVKSANTIKS